MRPSLFACLEYTAIALLRALFTRMAAERSSAYLFSLSSVRKRSQRSRVSEPSAMAARTAQPGSVSCLQSANLQFAMNPRTSLYAAGEPLLQRAQEQGVVRPDVEFSDVMQMVMGIGKIPTSNPAQVEHILRIALDGLRFHPGSG